MIFGSNIPSNAIESSGRELVIKFKSHTSKRPLYIKSAQSKFVIGFTAKFSGKL